MFLANYDVKADVLSAVLTGTRFWIFVKTDKHYKSHHKLISNQNKNNQNRG